MCLDEFRIGVLARTVSVRTLLCRHKIVTVFWLVNEDLKERPLRADGKQRLPKLRNSDDQVGSPPPFLLRTLPAVDPHPSQGFSEKMTA